MTTFAARLIIGLAWPDLDLIRISGTPTYLTLTPRRESPQQNVTLAVAHIEGVLNGDEVFALKAGEVEIGFAVDKPARTAATIDAHRLLDFRRLPVGVGSVSKSRFVL